RHTRWPRDWSSDVCSSDLTSFVLHALVVRTNQFHQITLQMVGDHLQNVGEVLALGGEFHHFLPSVSGPRARDGEGSGGGRGAFRSEERRVGKECRSGCLSY